MEFKLISKTYLKGLKTYGHEYKHKSGLTLIFVKDKNCNQKTSINISIYTPAIDNRGAAHIIEHCIASQMNSMKFLKHFAKTYQDKTSYEYVLNENDIEEIDSIINGIFVPSFKKNKNIFLKEGWRLEEYNNKLSIKGVVFDEIRDAFASPIYNIINYIPFTLYNGSVYGNVSGGLIEDILDLSYDDLIEYYNRYYTLRNCCIFIHGNHCINNIIKILSPIINKLSIGNEVDFIEDIKLKEYEKISNYSGAYLSTVEDIDGYNFKSVNFAIDKPKNQFEYNIYYLICRDMLEHKNEIFIKDIKKYKIGKKVSAIFKNSLYKPFFSIILYYCRSNTNDIFLKICKEILSDVISNINIDQIPNFVLGDIFDNYYNIDGLKLGTYVMEAFFSNIPCFSYIVESKDDKEKIKFINKIKEELIASPNYSIITLYPYVKPEKIKSNDLIRKARKKSIVNEYNPIRASTHLITDSFININKNIFNEVKRNLLFENPELKIHDDIKYFFYSKNDSKINTHIYFDITEFTYEELCLTSILNIYFKSYLDRINCKDKIRIGIYPIFDEKNNSVSSKLVVHLSTNEVDFKDLLIKLKELLTLSNLYKDSDIIKEKLCDLKVNIDINLVNNIRSLLPIRLLSYFSNCNFHKDATNGIGFYNFLTTMLNNNDNYDLVIKKIFDISKHIFTVDKLFVSIYAKNKDYVFNNISDFLLQLKKGRFKRTNALYTNKKNEGFISTIKTNYIALGFNYSELGFKYSSKYKILCNIITHNYLFSSLRNKYNVYASELSIIENNLIFFSMKDPNFATTFEVFRNTGKYITTNINTILKDFNLYKYNYIIKAKDPIITCENDLATIKLLYPNLFKDRSKILSELEDNITKEDIFIFCDMVEKAVTENYYCIFGNEEIIKENEELFSSINYLPIYQI
ncbi:putative peptidase [Gottschalkia acidurici 9a]|uniref:Peptidase n=1 Tax=Gottschalkia acidurici (strain ATCC 7906 / DSM 604 / BCRC 14475 / CIP 104303 / KCTC 5404 / NCIMB 10678 / 9a) TaxID=1128398 RepID=K0AZS4_GOTA9|nr:insulinase family protein [Gottschalkia acidurici]AFS77856.1 putative peptidase [Gottschalkia acidurici 9a]